LVAAPAWATPGHPDQVIFETDLVTVGAFRCPVDHPLFRNTGPIHQSCVVFPRTSVRIEHETGPAILADPTVVTMYNAGQVVERQAISAEGDRCDWYSMAPGILRDAVRTLDRPAADEAEHVIRKPSARSSSALYLRQRRLFVRVQTDRRPEALEVEETVCSIVRDALASAYGRPSVAHRPATSSKRKTEIAEAAKRILAKRFRLSMSLGSIAQAIGCTPFALSRVFHDVTGMTLHRYRAALRLRASLELVEAGQPLTAIALELGYSSHSHFTEAFRSDFGVPPSQAAVRRLRMARK
jgi:AraC-like DNA-binding protein